MTYNVFGATLNLAQLNSVCLSVTRRYCNETAAVSIQLVFRLRSSIDLSYAVFEGDRSMSKNKGTFLRNFVPKSGLRKSATVRLPSLSATNK